MGTKKASKQHGDHVLPPPPARTVKPRKRTRNALPIVAVGRDNFLAESGETGTMPELVDQLPRMPSTLFATLESSSDFVAMLSQTFILKDNASWTWRAHCDERNMTAPNGFMRASRVTTVVNYFGWQGADHNKGCYHRAIDPVTFSGQQLRELMRGDAVDDVRLLLHWTTLLRDFCAENNLDIRPTQGSVAAQFLTDPRFYPRARRKVPAKINERARESLPGNHYYLNVRPDRSNNFTAHYLDQHRAHHYHARTTPLPDSDHCYAFGRFTDLAKSDLKTDPHFYGLYCLDLIAPKIRLGFDWIGVGLHERIGDSLESVFIYSNELQHLRDVGYRVRSVRAAWGSSRRDTGIPQYAQWAESQLDRYSDAPWLKPLLLSTYGVLATKPKERESIFRLAKRGEPVRVKTGRRELNGYRVTSPKKLEPGVAHVLQRGMIEAATRSESIGLAQWLDFTGHTILSIYADAVIVEADDDRPLPDLPEPWRCKRELNHLQFINQQAFMSDGMTKLPGVSRDGTAYRQATMPGYAPRRRQTDLLTGKSITSKRRI